MIRLKVNSPYFLTIFDAMKTWFTGHRAVIVNALEKLMETRAITVHCHDGDGKHRMELCSSTRWNCLQTWDGVSALKIEARSPNAERGKEYYSVETEFEDEKWKTNLPKPPGIE